jgi:hypothetical protein
MNNAANDNNTFEFELEYPAPTSLEDLVCTQCACCARDLTDAQSIERGIGPECFGRYYDKCSANADFVGSVKLAEGAGLIGLLGEFLNRQDARSACNVVVRAISAQWDHPKRLARIELVHALGFTALANRLEERAYGTPGIVTVTERDGQLVVKMRAVKGEAFNDVLRALRSIPTRRWNGRENTFAIEQRPALWRALCEFLPGRKLKSTKGDTYIPGRVIRAADAA